MKTKYRVWNGERYITDLDYYILGIDTEGNAFYVYPNPESEFKEIIKDCIIEFSTGFKDRNGKEIYEGDIINKGKGEIFYNEKRAMFQVRWHDKFWLQVRGNNPNYHGGEPLLMNSSIVWEVIGTIHDK